MNITIRSFAHFREIFQSSKLTVTIASQSKLSDLLNHICYEYPELGKQLFHKRQINSNILIILNGNSIDTVNISQILLKEGDEVVILPPAGGG